MKGAFNNYLYSEDSIEIAKSWYEGTHPLSRHELNLREKWSIVMAIHGSSRYSTTQKALIFSKAYAEDNTDTKQEFTLKIDAMTANKAQRDNLFSQYISCDTMSFKQMQYSITGFVSKWVCKDLKEQYFESFFDQFMKVKASKSYQYFLVWSDYLFPSSKDKAYLIKKIKLLLPQIKDDSVLTKTLLQTLDGEERAAKVLGIQFD